VLTKKMQSKNILMGDSGVDLLNVAKTGKKHRPIKVLQFGEGNFLRAFVDYFIDIANEKGKFDGDIVLVKPIESGNLDLFHAQDCQYTVCLRGMVDGAPKVVKRIVTSVADAVDAYSEYAKYSDYAKLDSLRYIVSNTTEAGIVYDESDKFEYEPPRTYPGKLCKFLHTRYEHFSGAPDKGLVMLPVELIDDNGLHLKECVVKLAKLWNLEDGFIKWLDDACVFTQTLVDRIVTGYPRDDAEELWKEFGYRDNIVVTAEPFGLWVIESSRDISREFPLPDAGLPVIFTDNHHPYKQRKVRILNGAHTSFVLAAYLSGYDYVRESLEDELIGNFMHDTIYNEVIPTLDLPKDDLINFAQAVDGRFKNPYIKHALLSISLNSVSKWRTRCMPSLIGYIERKGELPRHLTFSIAALMAFYTGSEIRGKVLIGHRGVQEYEIHDDEAVVSFFAKNSSSPTKEFVHSYLSNVDFHGQDLSQVQGLEEAVVAYLDDIRTFGMRDALEKNF
jgi:tagaturonate reductase